jgi:NAD(P)H dehydrogenase (quinone)
MKMAKVLIVYYSSTGNTEKMAKIIRKGVESEGVETVCKRAEETAADELPGYDGIIVGSPTYYGSMSWEVKKLLDESVKFHGKLQGKVGAAFTSSANIGGGNETTIMSILKAFLIHGMVVEGDADGDHYGPVAIGAPDKRSESQCSKLGQKVANLVKKLEK